MPPHSASLSVEDSLRGPLGELDGARNVRTGVAGQGRVRSSVPMSIDSRRDSLEAHYDELPALPSALSPSSPHYGARLSPGGIPLRPSRSGLDLQLPEPGSTPGPLKEARPQSGFPWSRPPLVSGFSTSSPISPDGQLLSPKPNFIKETRPISTFSINSVGTSRSGNSTMSYILDPPQIITPANPQGLRRVEVMGSRQHAGLVTLPGSNPISPNPVTPISMITLTTPSNTTSTNPVDPFADPNTLTIVTNTTSDTVTPLSARFSSSAVGGSPLSPLFQEHSRPNSNITDVSYNRNSDVEESYRNDPQRWTNSTQATDAGGEYINIGISPGSPGLLTMGGNSASNEPWNRSSIRSSLGSVATTPSITSSPHTAITITSSPITSSLPLVHNRETDNTSPLPAPFLPFANQKPTPSLSDPSRLSVSSATTPSRTKNRIDSSEVSIREGFGSGFSTGTEGGGLGDIPFQLGFPGRMSSSSDGGTTRGSFISALSHDAADDNEEEEEEEEEAVIVTRDPFGKEAEIGKMIRTNSEEAKEIEGEDEDELEKNARMARSLSGED